MTNSQRLCCLHAKNSPPPPLFGKALAATRVLFGVNGEQLSSAAGISTYSLSRLERGHRSASPGELETLLSLVGNLAEAHSTESLEPVR
ncbi:MAG: helix-turn-helix transcriptional regulator [Nitrospira sp.]